MKLRQTRKKKEIYMIPMYNSKSLTTKKIKQKLYLYIPPVRCSQSDTKGPIAEEEAQCSGNMVAISLMMVVAATRYYYCGNHQRLKSNTNSNSMQYAAASRAT